MTLNSTAINVTMIPFGDAPMPLCRITDGGTPAIRWEGTGLFADVDLLLGNVDDPGDYLRRLGHVLTAFGHEVDAARDQREPKGYDAPVGHFDERAAAEMHQ
jgi:hypothetical protein